MKKSRGLPEFDRYEYYRRAVQSPDVDCEFLGKTYREMRGRPARVLREDFCGTFAVCCQWVRGQSGRRAIGIDLDPEPLDYGRQRHLLQLTPAQRRRVSTIQGSVLTANAPKADIVTALNFSFFIFKSRLLLRQYFARALRGLKHEGMLIVDAFGGSSCQDAIEEKSRIGGFWYFWDQTSYNPITHEAMFHIHFKRKGEAKRRNVFSYDWRLWTIPEIREAMSEAWFRSTHVYWEGTTRSGHGNGKFRRSENGESCDAWVVYIVGLA